MPVNSVKGIRPFRSNDRDIPLTHESSSEAERVPFLTQEQAFLKSPDLEDGEYSDPSAASTDTAKIPTVTCSPASEPASSFDHLAPRFSSSRWRWPDILSLNLFPGGRRIVVHKDHIVRRGPLNTSHRPTALKKVLRWLAFSLMLLGLLEFIALLCGLLTSFFPDDADDEFDAVKSSGRLPQELGHWPTDFSADIHPVACHSHNDYWRKEPLFSALDAGCTGVEADVWLYDSELYVGHSIASLTSERTLRSLYINPLVKILEQQNPLTSFHPTLDVPRNGVFDTKPAQSLVLLIDFKNEGHAIWPHVVKQLDPLRRKNFLTYFNGTSVVEGPITVVVTGNAPFNEVVANQNYRDIFFDAPLGLMEKLSDTTATESARLDGGDDAHYSSSRRKRSENQGQGLSGAAPTNPAIYSPANSYYASVSFSSAVGWPWRGRLSRGQIERIRKQVAGAHARGLKVRYWSIPSWPRGMRNYLWRTLAKEGVDYLNVDDLQSATKGDWNWDKKSSWFSGPWRFWSSSK
ncbi:uncharacterized protein Z518_02989 [Rhinocladiella mackenziei CBS 650.93]|uniref:Altered inheritance of mitochondria protein 6 n=1 Tax=Rhinocladiella mackenziei CBS 650.93 TaxID=1442369 RepID=A0A0D2HCY5_9EURO|nr:uncharacterized protein Z518_02989 [Rhinocladiella mackenziei CBS 650.93]KIX08333.1 hypothetical protein Z518_02989 [Rhinocladiella mackenziei CBS 650.93]